MKLSPENKELIQGLKKHLRAIGGKNIGLALRMCDSVLRGEDCGVSGVITSKVRLQFVQAGNEVSFTLEKK